ncbi:MAG: diaminopimelate epimerase [Prevotella sp.]|nr:diaminopimelate epimerase [Prevotella sp.]MBQ9645205.1 diaminopimelate epimerase [Prevotella sp.]
MPKIPFTKMHGCGNDYIYVNAMEHPIADPSRAAILWSDRHKGIGSDGLVLIDRSPVPEADYSMRIFNADGSEAMMCGNASRCIGKYVYERELTSKTTVRLLTLSGIKTLLLNVADGIVGSVTVDMGEPQVENAEQFIPTRGLTQGTFVSMGNPHYVIFTDDVDQVGETGRALEHHPAFPQRCNIEFARIEPVVSGFPADTAPRIRTRVWERGSGITQACGTGACATAVAACLTGRAGRESDIVMDGGTLHIEWCEEDRSAEGRFFKKNHVYMTGPAAFVFDGEIEINSKL